MHGLEYLVYMVHGIEYMVYGIWYIAKRIRQAIISEFLLLKEDVSLRRAWRVDVGFLLGSGRVRVKPWGVHGVLLGLRRVS